MYLWSLDVTVRNHRSGEIVATGNIHQRIPHSVPDAREKSRLVIDSIFPGT